MKKYPIYWIVFIGLISACSSKNHLAPPIELPTHQAINIFYTETYESPSETPEVTRAVTPTVQKNTATVSQLSKTPVPTSTLTPSTKIRFNSEKLKEGWIAFSSMGLDSGVFIINTNGKEPKKLTTQHGNYSHTTWSPDGHWIIFSSDFESETGVDELYILNVNGDQLKRLTFSSNASETHPAWSPGGNYIVYSRRSIDSGTTELHIIDSTGRYIQQLTNDSASNFTATWSPDGKSIAYTSYDHDDDSTSLVVINMDGSERKEIVEVPWRTYKIIWSQSRFLVVYQDFSGNRCPDLFMKNVENGEVNQITRNVGPEIDPCWSPDGKFVLYNATKECDYKHTDGVALGWEIYIQDLETGAVKIITDNPEWYPLFPDWSPVPGMMIGKEYSITELGNNLNFRASASTASPMIKKLITGDTIIVLDGPLDNDDYYWWKVRTADNDEGWIVEVDGWYTDEY